LDSLEDPDQSVTPGKGRQLYKFIWRTLRALSIGLAEPKGDTALKGSMRIAETAQRRGRSGHHTLCHAEGQARIAAQTENRNQLDQLIIDLKAFDADGAM